MTKTVVYLKCTRSVQTQKPKVFIRDVAALYSSDDAILLQCMELVAYKFSKPNESQAVVSVIHLISIMEKACPDITVISVGESDVLIEYKAVEKPKKWLNAFKIFGVCSICFFGTMYTIMAFHNDIQVHGIFNHIYELVMGYEPQGINPLEVSYSIGLGIGIIVFFNHLGRNRLRRQPTPIEVSMKLYEEDMDRTIIETSERLGIVKEG